VSSAASCANRRIRQDPHTGCELCRQLRGQKNRSRPVQRIWSNDAAEGTTVCRPFFVLPKPPSSQWLPCQGELAVRTEGSVSPVSPNRPFPKTQKAPRNLRSGELLHIQGFIFPVVSIRSGANLLQASTRWSSSSSIHRPSRAPFARTISTRSGDTTGALHQLLRYVG